MEANLYIDKPLFFQLNCPSNRGLEMKLYKSREETSQRHMLQEIYTHTYIRSYLQIKDISRRDHQKDFQERKSEKEREDSLLIGERVL